LPWQTPNTDICTLALVVTGKTVILPFFKRFTLWTSIQTNMLKLPSKRPLVGTEGPDVPYFLAGDEGFALNRNIRGGADKSLARPGEKQATATKLGIYSTYSPRSSIHFLARCSNFCKPLKKIQNVLRPTKSPRQQ